MGGCVPPWFTSYPGLLPTLAPSRSAGALRSSASVGGFGGLRVLHRWYAAKGSPGGAARGNEQMKPPALFEASRFTPPRSEPREEFPNRPFCVGRSGHRAGDEHSLGSEFERPSDIRAVVHSRPAQHPGLG